MEKGGMWAKSDFPSLNVGALRTGSTLECCLHTHMVKLLFFFCGGHLKGCETIVECNYFPLCSCLQGRRAGAGPGQRGLWPPDRPHHGAPQPERLLPPPRHLRLLHTHLHHLHPAAAREQEPEPAWEHPGWGTLHPAAPPAAQEGGAAAAPDKLWTQGLLWPPWLSSCERRDLGEHHCQWDEVDVTGWIFSVSFFLLFFYYFISPSYISSLPFVFYLMLLCGRSSTLGKGVLHKLYKPVMEQTQT